MPVPTSLPKTVLPTLEVLTSTLPSSADSTIDSEKIAKEWFATFAAALSAASASKAKGDTDDAIPPLISLFLPSTLPAESFWRDILSLTWDFRTFIGPQLISKFISERLSQIPIHDVTITDKPGLSPRFTRVAEDVVWIQILFSFKTDVGFASGVVRIVPLDVDQNTVNDASKWKVHVIFTNLESLLSHPELTGPLRNTEPNHGLWEGIRAAEVDCPEGVEGQKPTVIVIGAGQSGLEVAARLKYMGMKSLVVDKIERVGDNWRSRYEALCLHDPVWYDHMPYLPFPSTWPVFTPALKLANWLEHYAEILELNVWTSSSIESLSQDPDTGKWNVTIIRKRVSKSTDQQPAVVSEEIRRFTGVNHVVFATGLGSGIPNTPEYPGMETFKEKGGLILHSTQHKRARDHQGKKVVVVGACTSAHDIAVDYYNHDIDVTMFQRSSTYIMSTDNGWKVLMQGSYTEDAPPVDIADRISASFPNYMSIPLMQRRVAHLAELDKDLLDGLHKVGFRTNMGLENTGFGLLAWSRAGGYYLDTGASGLISSGKIKFKSDSTIKEFTEKGIKFENGTELDADVVVFATGLGDPREQLRRVAGDALANRCGSVWGLNKEGEINGVWRDLHVQNLWFMMGNLALCRFHSSHLALQIKAIDEGIFGTRYSLPAEKEAEN